MIKKTLKKDHSATQSQQTKGDEQSQKSKKIKQDVEVKPRAAVEQLQQQLIEALEREKRALADYQNLVKRQQEDRLKLVKLANKTLLESLLSPLEHLSMAAEQLEDQGLNLVMQDLWRVLKEAGLEEIYPQGQKFDVNLMEVVKKEGNGETVTKVVKRGYKLNGQVIQHAKVVVK